ncbi:MAG: divergent PAP2 family protein [Flexilinea sp.]|nr:divergent PAP2 family protein [Flexilinea sp.]
MGSIFQNHALVAALIAMASAQLLKPFLHYLMYHEWDPAQMFGSGGMPSSHSAFVCSLALVTGMRAGFDSEVFAVAAVFGIIVLYDAANVRWQSGLHAQRINQILRELFRGQPISEETLKEVIGHTPRQVYAGAIYGMIVGLLVETVWMTR